MLFNNKKTAPVIGCCKINRNYLFENCRCELQTVRRTVCRIPPQRLCREDPQEQRDEYDKHKKTALQNTELFENKII